MANYAVKILKDKNDQAFIPFTTTTSVVTEEGTTLQHLLDTKYKVINNLITETAGTGVLDAAQGKILADKINTSNIIETPLVNGTSIEYKNGMYMCMYTFNNIINEIWPLEINLPSIPGFTDIYYVGLTAINNTGIYTGVNFEYEIINNSKIKIYVNNDQLNVGLNVMIIGKWNGTITPSI